jgi:coenzyme F420-reducing hydrogenase alpha subunit
LNINTTDIEAVRKTTKSYRQEIKEKEITAYKQTVAIQYAAAAERIDECIKKSIIEGKDYCSVYFKNSAKCA